MCGIAAIVALNNQCVRQGQISTMLNAMLHRGPDSGGVYSSGSVALGMRRLAIVDFSGSDQPMHSASGSITVIFNGEVYNYKEIRSELELQGKKFETNGDVEVLIHLYEMHGFEAVKRLNGMFAFVLYDHLKDLVWIARDRFGIKPLFYCVNSSSLFCSSDINALLTATPATIDENAMIDYLSFGYVPSPKSIYSGVKKLMPGRQLIIRNHEIRESSYWNISDTMDVGFSESHELFQETCNKLDNALQRQIADPEVVGLLLSGGVDSALLASMGARHRSPTSFHSFTANFHGKIGSDSSAANYLAKKVGTIHHQIEITRTSWIDALRELVIYLDEPVGDSAIIPTYLLSKHAKENGIKVLLSGGGGDEVFGGYRRYYQRGFPDPTWFANQKWIPASIWLLSKNRSLSYRLQNPARNFYFGSSGSEPYHLKRLVKNRDYFDKMLSGIDEKLNTFDFSQPEDLMKLDIMDYLPNNILSLTDKATMAASVEGRFPYLDNELVDYLLSNSKNVRSLFGNEKGILRRIAKQESIDVLLSKNKEGFNMPTTSWMLQDATWFSSELLSNLSPTLKSVLDDVSLKEFLNIFRRHSYGGQLFYSIFVLNSWLIAREK